MQVKAAVLHGPKDRLRIEAVNLEAPRRGEVLVRVGAAGVCHSDYHFMVGDRKAEAYPVILGHEGAGIVEAVGEGVRAVRPGDHVVLVRWSCGRCEDCARGRGNLCRVYGEIATGVMLDGTTRFRRESTEIYHFGAVSCFAEKTVVPEQGVVRIPPDVPMEVAAVIGCAVLTGVGAMQNAVPVHAGNGVLVIGVGGVGLSAVMGARLVGASPIFAADTVDGRLQLAREFGADVTINATAEDTVQVVRDATHGEGVEYAFDVTGTGVALGQAFEAVRRGGSAVAIGMAHPDVKSLAISPLDMVRQQKTVKGSYMGSGPAYAEVPRLIELYRSGRLPLDRLLTRTYPLEQINEGFEAMIRGEVARAVIVPSAA